VAEVLHMFSGCGHLSAVDRVCDVIGGHPIARLWPPFAILAGKCSFQPNWLGGRFPEMISAVATTAVANGQLP
jgi:hypothetical protein